MLWLWIAIGLIVLFILFRLWVALMGNWRTTLNRVITSYVANQQLDPGFSEKDVFMAVLDGRYPYSEKGLSGKLFDAKEQAKLQAEREIESGLSVLDKYDLTTLIYTCLVIENNSILNNNRYSSIEDILDEISEELNKQGFSQKAS